MTDQFHSNQARSNNKLSVYVPKAAEVEKSILDYEDHELSPGRMAAKKRFIHFDKMIREKQAELNYESHTESEESSESDGVLNYDKDFDENFFKKSLD